jgi:hypothetical protein
MENFFKQQDIRSCGQAVSTGPNDILPDRINHTEGTYFHANEVIFYAHHNYTIFY